MKYYCLIGINILSMTAITAIFGLSFKKPYLMEGLNLMIAKSADFRETMQVLTDFCGF